MRIILLGMLILTMFGFSSCQKANKMDTVKRIVENEFRNKNLNFKGPDNDGNYDLKIKDYKVKVNIQNISRDYSRDGDSAAIIRFVENVLKGFSQPLWEQVKDFLRFSLEPSDHDFGNAIKDSITSTISRVLVYTDSTESRISWITPDMLSTWGITKEIAVKIAFENMDKIIEGISPEFENIDGMKLGMIPIPTLAFKASIIIAPKFRDLVKKNLGWPVLAAIPCRDFIYVIPEEDKALLDRMGGVVQDEFRKSGYPLTTEVLLISDKGIKAIGEFPK